MLAVSAGESTHERLLRRGDLVFERKYDGIRALIEVSPGAGAGDEPHVHIWSRLGNDKTEQFPEIADGLAALVAGLSARPIRAGRRDRRRRRGRASRCRFSVFSPACTGAADPARRRPPPPPSSCST